MADNTDMGALLELLVRYQVTPRFTPDIVLDVKGKFDANMAAADESKKDNKTAELFDAKLAEWAKTPTTEKMASTMGAIEKVVSDLAATKPQALVAFHNLLADMVSYVRDVRDDVIYDAIADQTKDAKKVDTAKLYDDCKGLRQAAHSLVTLIGPKYYGPNAKLTDDDIAQMKANGMDDESIASLQRVEVKEGSKGWEVQGWDLPRGRKAKGSGKSGAVNSAQATWYLDDEETPRSLSSIVHKINTAEKLLGDKRVTIGQVIDAGEGIGSDWTITVEGHKIRQEVKR